MKVLTLFDRSGPKFHRCWLPLYLMPGVEMVVAHRLDEAQLEGVDILFINRIISDKTLNDVCQLRQRYGFKLVVDFDDHWRLDPDHYLAKMYEHFRASDLMGAYIQEADGVTVTHDRLAAEVRPLNANVEVLPNAIPRWGQFTVKRQDSPFTRLFWAGGVTHRKDLELLRGPLKRLSDPSAQMVLGGYHAGNPEYAAMRSAFTNGGRIRSTIVESLPVDKYYHAYAMCDIALVPLRDTQFNAMKSNLKILEAANMGAPVIVSKVHPYLGLPDHLVNYVERQGDWIDHINLLLRNPEQARLQGEALRDYCDQHFNFDTINLKRKAFFEYVTRKHSHPGEIPPQVPAMDGGAVADPATRGAGGDPAGDPQGVGPRLHGNGMVRPLRGEDAGVRL